MQHPRPLLTWVCLGNFIAIVCKCVCVGEGDRLHHTHQLGNNQSCCIIPRTSYCDIAPCTLSPSPRYDADTGHFG